MQDAFSILLTFFMIMRIHNVFWLDTTKKKNLFMLPQSTAIFLFNSGGSGVERTNERKILRIILLQPNNLTTLTT